MCLEDEKVLEVVPPGTEANDLPWGRKSFFIIIHYNIHIYKLH